MSQDIEQIVRDAEKQYREESDRIAQELNHYEFYNTFPSGFEKFQAMEQAQNQVQFDIAAALQKIRDTQEAERQARIEAEKIAVEDDSRHRRIDRNRFWITFIVTLIGSLAAVGSLIATIVLH